jgi:hypothetical protein
VTKCLIRTAQLTRFTEDPVSHRMTAVQETFDELDGEAGAAYSDGDDLPFTKAMVIKAMGVAHTRDAAKYTFKMLVQDTKIVNSIAAIPTVASGKRRAGAGAAKSDSGDEESDQDL